VARTVGEDTLILVETTVPPGTTEKVVAPIFDRAFAARTLDRSRLYLAHAYERVMPGPRYLESIINYHRVFAGTDAESARRARAFLEGFINTAAFPLTQVSSPTASEFAKVLENSFRATNIAFVQEWTEFGEAAGVDVFEVIDAIRVRPTHRNLMAPGFGVGGYCLPKDPLLADWAFGAHFGGARRLDVSLQAVRINDRMPLHTARLLERAVGTLAGKRIALLGVSYLQGVGDTRGTPSAPFYEHCVAAGATVTLQDPALMTWPEKAAVVHRDLEALAGRPHDVAVFAVRHPEYQRLTASDILRLFPELAWVVDANNVLTDDVARELHARGVRLIGIGKGHWSHGALGQRD
jgi:UDP-N-acetyl-D-glucosamine dehydrogenase